MQERCKFEVSKKLSEWGLVDSVQKMIIQELEEDEFIDEERYACSFTRGKFKHKKWGKIKIKHELMRKKITDNNIIKAAMQEIDENDYLYELYILLEKKNKLIRFKSQIERKNKLARFLIEKGYESDLVWNKIKEL